MCEKCRSLLAVAERDGSVADLIAFDRWSAQEKRIAAVGLNDLVGHEKYEEGFDDGRASMEDDATREYKIATTIVAQITSAWDELKAAKAGSVRWNELSGEIDRLLGEFPDQLALDA